MIVNYTLVVNLLLVTHTETFTDSCFTIQQRIIHSTVQIIIEK